MIERKEQTLLYKSIDSLKWYVNKRKDTREKKLNAMQLRLFILEHKGFQGFKNFHSLLNDQLTQEQEQFCILYQMARTFKNMKRVTS